MLNPMLRNYLFFLLVWSACTLSAQHQTHSVYFATDQHQLTEQARQTLDALADDLQLREGYDLRIEAHTDSEGNLAYNDRLAEKRAAAVRAYLLSRNIWVSRSGLASYGERRPDYSNRDAAGKQRNRRVDVRVDLQAMQDLSDLTARLGAPELQRFTINPQQNTKVIGREGTTLWIPAGAFVLADGSEAPAGPVEVRLREAYHTSDMVLSGLMTASGRQLLETGGMVQVEAAVNGQPLRLRDGQELALAMPANQPTEGMELFRGATDEQGQVSDWEAADQPAETDQTALINMPRRPEQPYLSFAPPKFKLDRSGKPEAPQRPQTPFRPHEPKRESFRYHPGFFKRLFTRREKCEAIEQARYEKAVSRYQEKMAAYRKDSVEHLAAQKRYEQKMTQYREALNAYKADLERQREEYRQSPAYRIARKRYEQRRAAADAIYQKQLAEWKAERDAKLRAFEESYEAVGFTDKKSLSQYFFRVNSLGWINCDRFYDLPESDKTELMVAKDRPAEDEMVYVIFKEINSMLRPQALNSHYRTQLVPKDAEVTILGIRLSEDGQAEMAVIDTRVDAQESYALDYAPCKLSAIRKKLDELNG